MLRFEITEKGGRTYALNGVLTVALDCDCAVPADSLTVTCPYNSRLRLHADRIAAFDGDKPVFSGQLDNITAVKRGAGLILRLNARSLAAALLDNEAEPLTYRNPTASLIERRHLQPFGLRLAESDTIPYYDIFRIKKGMSHWQVLRGFCLNRYLSEPRVTADGRVWLHGFEQPGVAVFADNGSGIPYHSLHESLQRHRLLSEVRLKFSQTNTYGSSVKNANPDAEGITRVRYVNAAEDKTTVSTAEKMLENSNRDSYALRLCSVGCRSGLLGQSARVRDSALGELNGLFVTRVRYTADGSGEKSEITLKKEKVLCG